MKRIFAVLLVVCLLFMVSCRNKQEDIPAASTDDPFAFTAAIGIGWNLGNSLDALVGVSARQNIWGKPEASEMIWGNPVTDEKNILDIKEMGFTAVRIPVSWGQHCNENGDVDPAWMARVKEVVDYAYGNGLYVILNSHHDNDYYDIGGCVESEEVKKASIEKMKKLWSQIAETFKTYNERLIFETLNEPRTEGSALEWSGGTQKEREVVYELNREIVSAIRKNGGKNATRYIMVPTYAASADGKLLLEMELPDDPRIIMSVHAYTPYSFTMDPSGTDWFSDSVKSDIDWLFYSLETFTKKSGVPVIIGECGTTNKGNEESRIAWADYYVKSAKEHGIPCFLWDNNIGTGSGAEHFGLYDRANHSWYFPDLARAYIEAAK